MVDSDPPLDEIGVYRCFPRVYLMTPLHHQFFDIARSNWSKVWIEDVGRWRRLCVPLLDVRQNLLVVETQFLARLILINRFDIWPDRYLRIQQRLLRR
jgi:hypothetical protein